MILDEFLEDLRRLQPEIEAAVEEELRAHAAEIAKVAAGKLGTYQPGWAPLSPSTIAKHGDTPLLDSEDLKESLEDSSVSVYETKEPGDIVTFHIGSPLDRLKWNELGTVNIPPRPVLVPSAIQEMDLLEKRLDRVVGETIDRVFGI